MASWEIVGTYNLTPNFNYNPIDQIIITTVSGGITTPYSIYIDTYYKGSHRERIVNLGVDFNLYTYSVQVNERPSAYIEFNTPNTYSLNFSDLLPGTLTISRKLKNQIPSLSLFNSNNLAILEGNIINKYNTENLTLKITPNDNDTSDTIQYTILLNSNTFQPYTTCQKGVEFTYTIPSSSFLIGNNTVQVKVKDNNGAESSINFTVNNQQLVTSYRCLNDLKPQGYNRSTISLGEIIEFINSQP